MKKTRFSLLAGILISLSSCNQEDKLAGKNYEKYSRFDFNHDSILSEHEINEYGKYVADSMMKSVTSNVKEENIQPEYKDSIQIIKRYTSDPNSAGGVDLNIVWKNKSKRTIKYARFQVSAINAVDDEVFSRHSIYNVSEWVRVTGPIKSNQVHGYNTYWECLWYNWDIKRCIITNVELEYMDGTIVRFPVNF